MNFKKSSLAIDPASQRRDYAFTHLTRSDLHENPFQQFDRWFQEATLCETILEPNAMTLSTADQNFKVTSRIVLLKGYDSTGFRFFSNSNSLKGKQITENPYVALLFYWPSLERQIKIQGTAHLLSRETTEEYFHSRPRNSQLGAWASTQSSPLPNRAILEGRMLEFQKKFEGKEIPVPDFWNGYLIAPHRMEFWQGRSNRLHDCFCYTKQENQEWKIERLNP